MMKTAAILYQRDGYDTKSKRLMGRQAAGEGFLKALARYSTGEKLYCFATNKTGFEDFCQQIRPWLDRDLSLHWIENIQSLKEAGTLYKPDPLIAQLAWQRRYQNPQNYSICGITHTIASKEVMAGIGDLLIAPVEPWDAVICTSQAVKNTIAKLIETQAEYLAQRLGTKPDAKVQLPVIPLGVDCDAFPQGNAAQNIRQEFRQKLGIGREDLVVIFVGRLIFHAKAHPVPMYLALEKAAQTTKNKVHLIQAGWFEDQQQEFSFKECAALFCPSVNPIFIDGRQWNVRQGIWSVADIFISLADNIQETFGLTPIEAMAAGLPVVVSDWNGYQETVRDGIDGFRIPTLMPPGGSGIDFAASYDDNSLNYSTYIGHISLMTAVDIDACVRALTTLFHQPELRQLLGENGRKHAREIYNWSVIIRAYENLWEQLTEIRLQGTNTDSLNSVVIPHPLCDDPCRLLSHYPTQILSNDRILSLGAMAIPERLQTLRNNWMTNFGAVSRSQTPIIDEILATIAQKGSLSVGEILNRYGGDNPNSQSYLSRTLVYLLKFDILRNVA
ncbi:MAG TPA: glycosyl transferase [Cyanobacteria bacterium UBA11149]|nr:glycosyl transferase [Cyanobacteria bacterium UBA11367]HBE56369.1 glycosyl transferase [Cyanobacteria bacterium UBA11366]HBK65510.1 glycosyl transferase [Cyanobacteria bacterium UBA11166]HBR76299.1 glycosyl transferase [Cyanobacteria bacterium UBA11159]HBS69149.1 glycosyl transferase [Cyanobacteria bacterium UBA11153]HBW92075.1 glycosyl transferase [Cyanobacteria bacterium UBA11149]HCA96993.1 glycosyl transferase [Cyanobacteria bacterium UBA9226]